MCSLKSDGGSCFLFFSFFPSRRRYCTIRPWKFQHVECASQLLHIQTACSLQEVSSCIWILVPACASNISHHHHHQKEDHYSTWSIHIRKIDQKLGRRRCQLVPGGNCGKWQLDITLNQWGGKVHGSSKLPDGLSEVVGRDAFVRVPILRGNTGNFNATGGRAMCACAGLGAQLPSQQTNFLCVSIYLRGEEGSSWKSHARFLKNSTMKKK